MKKLTIGRWNQEDVGESQPRRWGTTIEDVAETYTYISLQIRRINLEMRERHLSKIHSAYMIYLRATTSVVALSYKIEKVSHFTHFDQKTPTLMGVKLCINAQVL